ncbi:MAG: DUF4388 domain-containing protein [Deltaproteobacteria bacterium]|nr:DUF4388 domain-containing protein [Deltaproteobacteria bacterium]
MEHRRGARVSADFWIRLEGVDHEPRLRQGNLSVSGLYFRCERPVGQVGSVQFLRLASRDFQQQVDVLARVIRTISLEDLHAGSVTAGVALEFMPQSAASREALERVVRYVVGLQLDREIEIEVETLQHAPAGPLRPVETGATSRHSLHRMRLQTSWPVDPGDPVAVEIQSPSEHRSLRFDGEVLQAVPGHHADGSTHYNVDVRIYDRPKARGSMSASQLRVGGSSLTDALDRVFSDLIVPPLSGTPPRREHLVGLLSRIRIPTLLTMFELERMSGALLISRDGEEARLFVRDGRVVDVEDGQGRAAPRALATRLLAWDEGTFEFTLQAVDRPDRIGTSTTALLLDLAREADEAGRHGPS